MSVYRALGPSQDPNDPYNLDDQDETTTFEMGDGPDDDGVIQHDDGSATVMLGDGDDDQDKQEIKSLPHDHNLAEAMDEDDLGHLAAELLELFEADEDGRSEWKETYLEGLDYLGLKVEDRTKPWPGAAGVYHPLLMEAVVRFQSQAMGEIFPPAGPAKTRILGRETPDKVKLAQRVQDELNYQLICKMPDYRGETERLLFRLALVGSVFRKVYFDPIRQRMCAKFIPAEDFVVPYGETDITTAERFTHVQSMSKNEIKRYQVAGLFLKDVKLEDPSEPADDITEAIGEKTGVKAVAPGSERYTILEMNVDWDLGEDDDELPLPYVITLDRDSQKILSIRRNWKQDDSTRSRRSWFVAYEYVPGLGFYGLGLIHLIGGITKSVTGILRQLIDAGTLSNLPGGLKSRGLRIKGDDTPIRPGEFRDVDVTSGKIAEAITFLPYKEPSAVLMNLLGQLTDDGRRVGSIAEMDVGEMNAEAPVGTTLALLERAQKVMNAVQARLHASLQKELCLIADGIGEYMGPQYDYDVGDPTPYNRQQDFQANGMEVIPVSDPSATTMAQRVVQHQAALQMASQAPQVYDIPKLHRTGLEILNIKNADELVHLPDEMKPQDPITENMSILKGTPVKAFAYQDHSAHLGVHMAAMQDPSLQQMIGQSPNAQAIMAAAQAHIADHVAWQYRAMMEKQMGTQLPPPGQELNPQQETQLAAKAVPAAQALLQQHQQQQQQQQAQQVMQDPLVQLQAQELAIKQADQERKAQTDFAKMALTSQQAQMKANIELARIEAQKQIESAKIGVGIVNDATQREHEVEMQANQLGTQLQQTQMQTDAQKQAASQSPNTGE